MTNRADRRRALLLTDTLLRVRTRYGRATAYVLNRGRRVPADVRFEAGILVGEVGARYDVLRAPSWAALAESIRRRARAERWRGAGAWVDALLVNLAAGSLDLENARQFAEWVVAAAAS